MSNSRTCTFGFHVFVLVVALGTASSYFYAEEQFTLSSPAQHLDAAGLVCEMTGF